MSTQNKTPPEPHKESITNEGVKAFIIMGGVSLVVVLAWLIIRQNPLFMENMPECETLMIKIESRCDVTQGEEIVHRAIKTLLDLRDDDIITNQDVMQTCDSMRMRFNEPLETPGLTPSETTAARCSRFESETTAQVEEWRRFGQRMRMWR